MKLTRPPAAPEVARDLATVLAYLYGPTAATDIQAAVAAGIGSPAAVLLSPRSASQPAFALADAGDWSFLFCEGVSNILQGTLALGGYQGGITDSWTAPTNSYFTDVKNNIFAAAAANGLLARPNVTCVGHSLGGAVAALVAGQVRDTNRIANVSYCSYGAPKASCWAALQGVNRCDGARWFGPDDPVPLIMPTSADNLAMLMAFSVRENQRFSNFCQPFGGLSLGADGSINPATYPQSASVSTITNIAAWLYSLDTAAGVAHSLSTYAKRLTAAVDANAANADRPRHSDNTNDSGGSSARELTDAQRLAIKVLKEQEAGKHLGKLSIPQEFKAAVIKQGGVYQVAYNGSTISVASRKRTAHATARKLNSFLESCLMQGIVDKQGMQAALTTFFAAATDPGSGVAPQMSDQLGQE